MRYIQKYCKTLKSAEKYQNTLYDKYYTVKCVNWPHFTEHGIYTWQVSLN